MTTREPLRVLIVEHNPADVELCVHALEAGGFAATHETARNLDELHARLRTGAYDIVLADYRLPGWTGMDALAAIRAGGSDLPLILVTGTIGDERAVECLRAGAADYILKDNLSRLPLAVRRVLGEQRAIEEHRQSEHELRERDERFSQLADNIREVFFVVQADFGATLYINPAYEAILGQSRAALYANPLSFLDAIHPDDRHLVRDNMAHAQQGGDAGEVEFRVVRPDGTARWVRAHVIGVRNEAGEVYRLAGVILDVTERRHAEDALREREALMNKLAETSFDGIDRTVEGIIQEANRGFAEMFGYSVSEVLGRPILDFVAEESREEVARRVAEEVEGRYEFVGLHKDGHKLLLEATARTHPSGGQRGRITALRDVTEKKRLAEQFNQAQKMEAVGRLAGGVAHDFNNLLTVITSYSELLLEDLAPDDPRRSDVDEVLKAARGAASLTRQLLAFSRQQVIAPRLVKMEEVIAQADRMLRRLIGEDIEVMTILHPVPSTIRIDPGQLEQIILNLAVNSRDAMPQGGRITIETSVVDLDAGYTAAHWPATPGRYAMLAMTDSGIGMDEATRARIFEPFFTTKEAGKGTGLGLSTVYGIVKQSDGFIWAYSEPGQGTTFKIYLPYLDRVEDPAVAVPAAMPTRGTETIVVAEDELAVRTVVHQILARQGYTVLMPEDPAATLDIAAHHVGPIHLLLTDVIMPGMGGSQLAAKFTALRPDTRVLYMSGYTKDAIVRHGVLAAGVSYLSKPFSPDELARKVRQTLDAR